jgi:hypothetical protein
VLVLRVIFHGSATLFFVASGVAIPLVLVCSALPFLGPARVGFFWGDIVNVVATLLGLFMYRMRAEDIEFDLPPFEGEPAVPPDVTMLNDEPLLENASAGGARDGDPPFTPILSYLPNDYADPDYDGRPSSPNISSPYAYSRRDDYWDADESDDERTIVVASMPGAVRGGVGHGAGGFGGFAVRLPPPPRLSLGGLASATGAVTDAGASRSLNFAQF